MNSVTFQDSTAERPDSPDITSVVVSNTNTGEVSFKINGPARLTDDMLVDIELDTDANPATGDPDTGSEYAIELFGGTANLFKWDGTNFSRTQTDPPQTTLVFSGLTIKLNTSELGNPTRLSFGVVLITGIRIDPSSGDLDFANAHADLAPDPGHGLWSYEVKTTPLRLLAKKLALAPSRPRAGRPLTANLTVARNDTGAILKGGAVTCVATVGGARIAARVHKFVGNLARCTWQVPASARGKSVHGTISVVFEGKRISRSFTATVG